MQKGNREYKKLSDWKKNIWKQIYGPIVTCASKIIYVTGSPVGKIMRIQVTESHALEQGLWSSILTALYF